MITRKKYRMKIKAGKFKKPGKSTSEMTIAAGNAMKNGFYTEAIWILSGIMEKRLKKMIMLTEGRNPGAAPGIEQLLKRLKLLQKREQYVILKSEVPTVFINTLRSWKNNRNIMMKDMIEMHVSWERKERQAKQGVALLKELNKIYKKYKLAIGSPPPDKHALHEFKAPDAKTGPGAKLEGEITMVQLGE
jgi:hypothetical protein